MKEQRIWLIFGLLFLGLGLIHFYIAFEKVEDFEIRTPLDNNTGDVRIRGVNIYEPLRNFASDINIFVGKFNSSTFKVNLIAAIGYLTGSATCFYSLYLSKKNH